MIPEFVRFVFTHSAPYRDGWVGGGRTGNYGADVRMRSVVNFAGIWANTNEEVVYFAATHDASGAPLDGSRSYTITFAPDALPGTVVDAYWSIILVGLPDLRVVPNDLERYNLNTHSPLTYNQEGSLVLTVGAQPAPGVPEANWIPARDGQPFSLTFRAYVPRATVLDGTWAPPGPVEASTGR